MVCPAELKLITPPHWHMSLQELLSAGLPAMVTVGEPGAHGAVVTGTHGMGVSTPCAAAVALMTWGFAVEEHMPKGRIFLLGMLSMIVAAGNPPTVTLLSGVIVSAEGDTPNEHCIIPDITACCPIMI